MISKKKFVEIINRLQKYDEMQDRIQDIFKECVDNKEQDFCNAGSICIGHETVVIELLSDIFNEKDSDIISWWIYAKEYGKKFKIGNLEYTDKNGNKIIPDLSTAEKFYDYLTKTY